ncbi:hypothetical protein JHK84_048028 [Glycine max]|nr:hypothetical protein JHK85_048614 [Glycine max]KAG5103059.1 hypothetical protein JHK84_048028 [Glycine max]KAH1203134.1 hypothetical protein GmHk_17G049449 [Glycine max]
MESESVVAYCSGDITSSSEEMLFECPSGSKVVTISEDMSLDALRKTYMDAIGEFSSKGPIELNANFGRSPNEILALLHKPSKPRSIDEITVLMRDKSM